MGWNLKWYLKNCQNLNQLWHPQPDLLDGWRRWKTVARSCFICKCLVLQLFQVVFHCWAPAWCLTELFWRLVMIWTSMLYLSIVHMEVKHKTGFLTFCVSVKPVKLLIVKRDLFIRSKSGCIYSVKTNVKIVVNQSEFVTAYNRVKRAKTCNQCRKTCNQCQARENM